MALLWCISVFFVARWARDDVVGAYRSSRKGRQMGRESASERWTGRAQARESASERDRERWREEVEQAEGRRGEGYGSGRSRHVTHHSRGPAGQLQQGFAMKMLGRRQEQRGELYSGSQ
jgi:hypothetical protein